MPRRDQASSLTQAQLGLWLGHQRAQDPSVFHAAECVLIEGVLEEVAFERALDRTLSEASALHVVFREERGVPQRVAVPYAGTSLEHVSLEGGEAALVEHAERVLREPIDLERGPLYRHQLVRLGPERQAWLHVCHHIALDGYGFSLIARRVASVYAALVEDRSPEPPTFSDFDAVLSADTSYRGSAREDEARAFYRDELSGLSALTLGDAPEPGRARRRRRYVEAATVSALRDVCAQHKVNWPEVAVAIVADLLGHRTGQRDFVLGLPVMLRLGTPAVRTPCMAMNIAPLPIRLREGSLLELTSQVKTALARQRRHHAYRYEALRVDLGQRPFGAVVNVLPFDLAVDFGPCRARVLGVSAGPVEDLSISFAPRGGELEIIVDGHIELFEGSELEDLAARLADALSAFVQKPLHVRSAPAELARDPVPLARFLRFAQAEPHAPALVQGEVVFSRAELVRAVFACAASLREAGLEPGELLAIEQPRSPLAIVLMLAAGVVGAGTVMLDPTHPLARRQRVLALAKPRLTVIGAESDLLFEADQRWCVQGPAQLVMWSRTETQVPTLTNPELAYVVFTSGSTGEPKGVCVGGAALAAFVARVQEFYAWNERDRVLQFAPLTFDACIEEIFVTLAQGATLVLRDPQLDSVDAFLDSVSRAQVSILDLPTAFWHELVLAMELRSLRLPACVRQVIIGGEAAQPARVLAFTARAPGVQLLNTYGPSEATVVAAVADLTEFRGGDVAIGLPLSNVQAVLVGADLRPLVGSVAAGELCLAGATLARGYLGRDDLTRARFVHLPAVGRAYRTGDLVMRDEAGVLYFRGRVDDELKISGHRIAPAEVESVLTRHDGVRAAIVLAETSSDGGKRLVAHVEAGPELSVDTLRAFLKLHLPEAMVPSHIVVHAGLPRNAHGKIDRAALRTDRREEAEVVSGASVLEQKVLSAWRAVLGPVPAGVDDDFFALGGTSLQVIQLANRLSNEDREVRVSEIFRHPTPRKQAALLAANVSKGRTSFAPRRVYLPARWFGTMPARTGGAGRVLLTGATGFVGIHLLERLLREGEAVVCAVRASSVDEAARRVSDVARSFDVDLARVAHRIEYVPVDLALPASTRAWLVDRIAPCATVVHCAAQVSVVRDYESLFASNVLATRELLGLATAWAARFHFVSSVAILPGVAHAEERPVDFHAGLADGYQRSKWHAEQLCVEAARHGLSVAIYRMGRVVGSRARPVVHRADLLWRIAQSSVRASCVPNLTFEEPWIPADEAADLLVRLARSGSARAPVAVYHLVHTGNVSFAAFRAALARSGYDLPIVPLATWMEKVRSAGDDQDRATLAFFELREGEGASVRGPDEISWMRVRELLPDVKAHPIDSALLDGLCAKARASGLFGASGVDWKENGHVDVR